MPVKVPPDAVTVIVVPVVVTRSPVELTSLIFASVLKVVGDSPPTGCVTTASAVGTLAIVTVDAMLSELGPVKPRLSMTLLAASRTITVPSEVHTTVSVNVMP
ncbi:unannotated protein [freshwater metagenome]|uniref:Unannotated protein n=1 Tax=freshwater metagenome TaxID=449393 RepID=A0A6J6BAD1_9ZZZZ